MPHIYDAGLAPYRAIVTRLFGLVAGALFGVRRPAAAVVTVNVGRRRGRRGRDIA